MFSSAPMGLVTWKEGVPFGTVSGRNLNLTEAKKDGDRNDVDWGTFTTDDIFSRLGGGSGVVHVAQGQSPKKQRTKGSKVKGKKGGKKGVGSGRCTPNKSSPNAKARGKFIASPTRKKHSSSTSGTTTTTTTTSTTGGGNDAKPPPRSPVLSAAVMPGVLASSPLMNHARDARGEGRRVEITSIARPNFTPARRVDIAAQKAAAAAAATAVARASPPSNTVTRPSFTVAPRRQTRPATADAATVVRQLDAGSVDFEQLWRELLLAKLAWVNELVELGGLDKLLERLPSGTGAYDPQSFSLVSCIKQIATKSTLAIGAMITSRAHIHRLARALKERNLPFKEQVWEILSVVCLHDGTAVVAQAIQAVWPRGEGVYHIVAGELNSQHLTPEYIKAVVQFISSLLLTTSASANELRNVCAELTRARLFATLAAARGQCRDLDAEIDTLLGICDDSNGSGPPPDASAPPVAPDQHGRRQYIHAPASATALAPTSALVLPPSQPQHHRQQHQRIPEASVDMVGVVNLAALTATGSAQFAAHFSDCVGNIVRLAGDKGKGLPVDEQLLSLVDALGGIVLGERPPKKTVASAAVERGRRKAPNPKARIPKRTPRSGWQA